MAEPVLITVRDYATSRYSQVADNTEGQLSDILVRAEEAIQTRIGRRLLVQPYTETFMAKSQTFFVRQRPIVAVSALKRRPNSLFSWSDMLLSRIRIEHGPGYVECIDTIKNYELQVTYTAGYTTIPEDLKEAIIMQAVLFSVQDLEVYGTGDSRAPGYIMPMNNDIDRIVHYYRANPTVYH